MPPKAIGICLLSSGARNVALRCLQDVVSLKTILFQFLMALSLPWFFTVQILSSPLSDGLPHCVFMCSLFFLFVVIPAIAFEVQDKV